MNKCLGGARLPSMLFARSGRQLWYDQWHSSTPPKTHLGILSPHFPQEITPKIGVFLVVVRKSTFKMHSWLGIMIYNLPGTYNIIRPLDEKNCHGTTATATFFKKSCFLPSGNSMYLGAGAKHCLEAGSRYRWVSKLNRQPGMNGPIP